MACPYTIVCQQRAAFIECHMCDRLGILHGVKTQRPADMAGGPDWIAVHDPVIRPARIVYCRSRCLVEMPTHDGSRHTRRQDRIIVRVQFLDLSRVQGPIVDLNFIKFSGQTTSAGGMGKTTTEMQIAKTFLDAAWDFMNETTNGTEDIWWVDEGKDYPCPSWQLSDGTKPNARYGGGVVPGGSQ